MKAKEAVFNVYKVPMMPGHPIVRLPETEELFMSVLKECAEWDKAYSGPPDMDKLLDIGLDKVQSIVTLVWTTLLMQYKLEIEDDSI